MKAEFLLAAATAAIGLGQPAVAATTASTAGTPVKVGGVEAADGQSLDAASTWGTTTDPEPFDRRYGFDDNSLFSVDWSQTFAALTGTVDSATILIGLYDVDSFAPGNQIGSFTLNGFDLTALLNAAVEAKPYDSLIYGLYQINVPTSIYASLTGGTANFHLALAAPGRQAGTNSNGNAGLIDFSTLTITTSTPQTAPVPEPSTWAMMLLGFAGVGVVMRRGRARGIVARRA